MPSNPDRKNGSISSLFSLSGVWYLVCSPLFSANARNADHTGRCLQYRYRASNTILFCHPSSCIDKRTTTTMVYQMRWYHHVGGGLSLYHQCNIMMMMMRIILFLVVSRSSTTTTMFHRCVSNFFVSSHTIDCGTNDEIVSSEMTSREDAEEIHMFGRLIR